jgi:hypothetical protein
VPPSFKKVVYKKVAEQITAELCTDQAIDWAALRASPAEEHSFCGVREDERREELLTLHHQVKPSKRKTTTPLCLT